jgi:flagellar biosynthesis protein FlhB
MVSAKTEEATPKRQQRAREDGDSGLSANLAQAAAFALAATMLPVWFGALIEVSADAIRDAIAHPQAPAPTAARLGGAVLVLALPPLLLVAVTSGLAQLLQTGGVVSAKRLALNFGKLNPVEGLKQLVSKARLFSVMRALIFAGVVMYWALGSLRDNAPSFAATAGSMSAVLSFAGPVLRTLLLKVAALGLALGAFDFLVSRAAWRKRLRMTKDEVRREHKESDGDPELKAARERAHHEALFSVQLANVKKATVVIVNPVHLACALHYKDGEDDAPMLVASGAGDHAARIVAAAHAAGVPVVRDVPLARALYQLSTDETIPEALYEAVAEVIRALWEETRGEGASPPQPGDPPPKTA